MAIMAGAWEGRTVRRMTRVRVAARALAAAAAGSARAATQSRTASLACCRLPRCSCSCPKPCSPAATLLRSLCWAVLIVGAVCLQ